MAPMQDQRPQDSSQLSAANRTVTRASLFTRMIITVTRLTARRMSGSAIQASSSADATELKDHSAGGIARLVLHVVHMAAEVQTSVAAPVE